jgi:formiminoglutamate deiminase
VTALWCEHAWLGGEMPERAVLIEITGDRISAVASEVDRPDGAEVLAGLTLPGFANTHSHAFHRALRGRTHRGEGSFWTWRDTMYGVAERLDPDGYHELARATYTEMVRSGYTVVGEFHYLHHHEGAPPNAMADAVLAAAHDAGIRITLLDTLYTHGGIEEGSYVAASGAQHRFVETPAQWRVRHDLLEPVGMAVIGAAIHSVRAVDPDGMAVVAGWADGTSAPLHAHVSEQPAENAQCVSVHARTPARLLSEHGALGPRFTAVHGTHLDPADIRLLAEAGSNVAMCPTTERDLADGIGPSVELAQAGVALCIGSDSHAVIDPFEETRAVELDARLATQRRGNHAVGELLTAGTAAGYAALGWNGGRIVEGALADLVTVGLGSVRLGEPAHDDLLATVLYAGHPEDVTRVMVAGRWR